MLGAERYGRCAGVGHKYIGHNYLGHNYLGHNHIGALASVEQQALALVAPSNGLQKDCLPGCKSGLSGKFIGHHARCAHHTAVAAAEGGSDGDADEAVARLKARPMRKVEQAAACLDAAREVATSELARAARMTKVLSSVEHEAEAAASAQREASAAAEELRLQLMQADKKWDTLNSHTDEVLDASMAVEARYLQLVSTSDLARMPQPSRSASPTEPPLSAAVEHETLRSEVRSLREQASAAAEQHERAAAAARSQLQKEQALSSQLQGVVQTLHVEHARLEGAVSSARADAEHWRNFAKAGHGDEDSLRDELRAAQEELERLRTSREKVDAVERLERQVEKLTAEKQAAMRAAMKAKESAESELADVRKREHRLQVYSYGPI